MRLSTKEILNIAFGYIEVIEEADGLRFCNYTKKQREAFSKWDEVIPPFDGGFTGRSSLATGVRLDFHTNSKSFAFDAVTGVPFEVSVNGLLAGRYGKDALPAHISLDGDMSRVTLWFPSHSAVGYSLLSWVELDDGASVTPHVYNEKLLFLGDSITHGWESDYIPLAYTHRVANALNADFVVQGTGGAQFWPETVDTLPFDPDRVFIALGTNDWGSQKTEAEIREAASKYIAKIANLYLQKKRYLLTPIWRADIDTPHAASFYAMSAAIAEEGRNHGFTVVDGLSLVPHIADFFTDGLHPSATGFSLMAENILRAIQ